MSVGALNGYWGQYGTMGVERLANHCDSGIEYVTLGFVNLSPENDPSGYPGTNFAAHCYAETYSNEEGVPSQLLTTCPTIIEDVPYCKERGVKVLLSIGGEYNDGANNYEVTSEENGVEFAEFLYKAFGPYQEGYEGPRPFDNPDTEERTSVDGFDFDIEHKFDDNKGYIAMVETLRELDPSLFITAAPQCPTSDTYFYLKDLINEAEFDALFIQFYNNEGCDASSGELNYNEWLEIIAGSQKSQDAKLFLGLPSSPSAINPVSGTGYIEPETVAELICAARDLPSWGGVSLWDLGRGAENIVGPNRNYIDVVQDALLGIGCPSATDSATEPIVPGPTSTPGNGTATTQPPITTTSITTEEMTTSTVYTTKTHTLPCPGEEKCPDGHYTVTETIPVYTTICPVEPTDKPEVPKPTGGHGGDDSEGGDSEDDKSEDDESEDDDSEDDIPGDDKPEDDKPEEGESEDDVPEGDKPEDDKPEEGSYDKTTTIVVPPPTGATPTPGGPTETPITGAASSMAASVSGLLAIAALQVLFL